MTFIAGTRSLPFYAERGRGRHDMSNISSFLLARTNEPSHVSGAARRASINMVKPQRRNGTAWSCLARMVGSYVVVLLHAKQTCAGDATSLLPSFLLGGDTSMTSAKFSDFWTPSPPLVTHFGLIIRVNPRNLPYYVTFWATPLPPPQCGRHLSIAPKRKEDGTKEKVH